MDNSTSMFLMHNYIYLKLFTHENRRLNKIMQEKK